MYQHKYSSATVNNNEGGSFQGFPTQINTSPMPSPSINFMFPSSQVSANNWAKGGFADRHPVQSSMDFSFPPMRHATRENEQPPLYKDAKIVNFAILNGNNAEKMPMSNFSGEGGGNGSSVRKNIQSGVKDPNQSLFWKANGWEMRPTTSIVTEHSDPISTKNKVKSLGSFEMEVTPELDPHHALASQKGNVDGATQGSMSVEVEGVDDRPVSRKRKRESFLIQYSWPAKPARDPKVIVQIESKDDIPDDGYCWRKYGQKTVKGNTNPRSYYKCTTGECFVRKHVERAAHDAKYVTSTYEGKHNHEVPITRRKNRINSTDHDELPGADNEQVAFPLPGGGKTSVPVPEAQFHTFAPYFDGEHGFNNKFMMPGMVGSFSNMHFGPSSIGRMNYSSLNNSNATMPYGSCGLNPYRHATPHHAGGSVAPVFSGLPMSPPLDLNLPPPGLDLNSPNPMGPEA